MVGCSLKHKYSYIYNDFYVFSPFISGKFKFVNHAAFDGPDFAAFRGPQSDPGFREVTLKGHGPPGHQKKFPGNYRRFLLNQSKIYL